MAIKMSQFVNDNGFSVLVNFPSKIRGVGTDSHSGYVLEKKMKERTTVLEYLKKMTLCSEERISKCLQLVKLKTSLLTVSLEYLTTSEIKKVQLAHALLVQSRVIVLEYFFEDLIYVEREYFKRFFRNLMYKQHISIILIENDMNFVCETVQRFYLFTTKEKYKLITDFYDDEIYKYVKMPHTVEVIKYFEKCGHQVDHEITFAETLKAIYRSVS